MAGSKGTRAGVRVTQAYTVAAVSPFFDRRRRRRRRRVTCLITLNYPRLRCLRLLVGPVPPPANRAHFLRRQKEILIGVALIRAPPAVASP